MFTRRKEMIVSLGDELRNGFSDELMTRAFRVSANLGLSHSGEIVADSVSNILVVSLGLVDLRVDNA